ncbi:histidine kinase [Methylobacterium oryzae]|uniref:histidine kinase n=1 Tax=Methylobacterium oryzae TaxID=334852 RepID=UPI002F2C0E4B
MADYYPLLARALDALPDRTPALRKAVYDRARNALISQLRSLDPPLSEADIDLERRALDAAIERLEVDHGGLPAPANDAVRAPEPPAAVQAVPDSVAPEPIVPAATEPEIPEPSPPEPGAGPMPAPVLPPGKPPFAVAARETVNAMVLTITPIDFHADTRENRAGHGFINVWTRSLTPEDVDRLIEAQGSLESGAPPRNAAAPAETGVAVAQRAELVEEASGAEGGQPTVTAGRVTWRLETVNGDQGQPVQNAVVATVTIPDAGLTLVMTIQRNLDATLPASHTVSLAFSQSGSTGASRTVQDVGLLQAKDEQSARGSPVSGLPVRVRDNLFLIGLSSLQNDVERNTDLLLHRNWFDIALRYTSGRRAVLTFEKGAAGAQVMQSAFDAWQ